MIMKTESEKSKKLLTKSTRSKPVCGTLSYLAECRGMTQKTGIARLTSPPGEMNRIVRRYPAAL